MLEKCEDNLMWSGMLECGRLMSYFASGFLSMLISKGVFGVQEVIVMSRNSAKTGEALTSSFRVIGYPVIMILRALRDSFKFPCSLKKRSSRNRINMGIYSRRPSLLRCLTKAS